MAITVLAAVLVVVRLQMEVLQTRVGCLPKVALPKAETDQAILLRKILLIVSFQHRALGLPAPQVEQIYLSQKPIASFRLLDLGHHVRQVV